VLALLTEKQIQTAVNGMLDRLKVEPGVISYDKF
tara:strand:+ start:1314 stop:1415 length:102 start_codon:yes stop_codon:yes gene_type:complete